MKFYLKAHTPGPFEFQLPLYVDDAGLRELKVTIKGTALAAEPPPD